MRLARSVSKQDDDLLPQSTAEQKALNRFRTEVMSSIDMVIYEFDNLSPQINDYVIS